MMKSDRAEAEEALKKQADEVAGEVALRVGLSRFVPTKFQGMSNTLRKRLISWKMGLFRKHGGKAYFAPWERTERKETKPSFTAAWRAKRRRKNKLARKARRLRRLSQ